MTKPLPFTKASLARAIKGVELAGRFVVGVNVRDGTLLISDKPLDTTSLVPEIKPAPPLERRLGDYFGSQGKT